MWAMVRYTLCYEYQWKVAILISLPEVHALAQLSQCSIDSLAVSNMNKIEYLLVMVLFCDTMISSSIVKGIMSTKQHNIIVIIHNYG